MDKNQKLMITNLSATVVLAVLTYRFRKAVLAHTVAAESLLDELSTQIEKIEFADLAERFED